MPSIASVPGEGNHGFWLDYDWDGNILELSIGDHVFVDVAEGIAEKGWQSVLAKIVKAAGWDEDDGDGLRAFVIKLKEDGFL